MPDTFVKIASVTVGSGGASSISFSSIPTDYTDLVLKWSGRTTTSDLIKIGFNGSYSSFSMRYLYGNGSSAVSNTNTYAVGISDGNDNGANIFSNSEIYIPNYLSSNNKSLSSDSVQEDNATYAIAWMNAGLWSNTSAINSIQLAANSGFNFVQYSTATLYGIKNS